MTLIRLYLQFEKEAEVALGLPLNVHSYALLPIGFPMGRFGPVRCIPLADVLATAGYSFSLFLRWLEWLLRALIRALLAAPWWRQTT